LAFLRNKTRSLPLISEDQYKALSQALKQNSYSISLQDGSLVGPGMQFLARSTANAQFVLFGEEHNVREFPEFLTALFAFLHQNRQFN
jgi:erythromycin esterase-like protein